MKKGVLLVLAVLFIFHSISAEKMVTSVDSIKDSLKSRIDTFSFLVNGKLEEGMMYVPSAFGESSNPTAIILIDFTEQHFKLATDEFEMVIKGANQVSGLDAVVVTLRDILDIDAEPPLYPDHYSIYRALAEHVKRQYSKISSMTFIGKGSESGVVLMTMFREEIGSSMFDNFIVTDPSPLYADAIMEVIENGQFSSDKPKKRLHFSFSTSNDRSRCTKLIELIRGASYPWLDFEAVEYTDSDYENTYPFSYAAGLKYVYSGN